MPQLSWTPSFKWQAAAALDCPSAMSFQQTFLRGMFDFWIHKLSWNLFYLVAHVLFPSFISQETNYIAPIACGHLLLWTKCLNFQFHFPFSPPLAFFHVALPGLRELLLWVLPFVGITWQCPPTPLCSAISGCRKGSPASMDTHFSPWTQLSNHLGHPFLALQDVEAGFSQWSASVLFLFLVSDNNS